MFYVDVQNITYTFWRTLIDDKTQAYVRIPSDERLKREAVFSVLYTQQDYIHILYYIRNALMI